MSRSADDERAALHEEKGNTFRKSASSSPLAVLQAKIARSRDCPCIAQSGVSNPVQLKEEPSMGNRNAQARNDVTRFGTRLALVAMGFVFLAGNEDCEGLPPRVTADLVDAAIRPQSLEVRHLQVDSDQIDNGLLENQPYFAFVRFSSEFGVPNSTDVNFIDTRVALSQVGNTDNGGPMEADFPQWIRDELEFGMRIVPHEPDPDPTIANDTPDIVAVDGLLVVGMEGDRTGWDPFGASGLKDNLSARAECLRESLSNHVEPTSWSPLNFSLALRNVQADLQRGCVEGTLSGGGSDAFAKFVGWLKDLLASFTDPDDPVGSAFIVRVGVTHDYFDASIAPLLSANPQTVCEADGMSDTVLAGCVPFLANPCDMRTDPAAISAYASICATGDPSLAESGTTGWYRRLLRVPFRTATGTHWIVNFDNYVRSTSTDR